jgi:glucose-6-phosphate isomerase
MIKFDFKTYAKKFIDEEDYNKLYSRKNEIMTKLNNSNMNGWTKKIDDIVVSDIKKTADYIKENYECLVVVGIGGSYLGSYAFNSLFKKYFNDSNFEVIYAGTTLSEKYLDELLTYLNDKNFCLNVISKSGTTMETNITYKLVKDSLKRKYSAEELVNRIIITTDKENGKLREEVNELGYKSFEIPNDIGGRYSFITPAHLLPLALNYDIDLIIDSYYDGKRLNDIAFEYAVTRKALFDKNKLIENFCVYEENMYPFTEWLKQLFGETEGKDGKGIFPVSTVNTRDLHSLGQFIQEGNKIIFETYLKVTTDKNYVPYNGQDIHSINNIVEDSVLIAHYSGNVPCLEIELDEINIENISNLIYFFLLSAAYSGYLFDIDPFNQPGVEVYKEEVRKNLNK